MKTIFQSITPEGAANIERQIFQSVNGQGVGWSGVLTDGKKFGILWCSPVSDLFGIPEDFPELVLVDDEEGEWAPYQHPELPPPQE